MDSILAAARGEIFHGEHKAHVSFTGFTLRFLGLPIFTVHQSIIRYVGHELVRCERYESRYANVRTLVTGLSEKVFGDFIGNLCVAG